MTAAKGGGGGGEKNTLLNASTLSAPNSLPRPKSPTTKLKGDDSSKNKSKMQQMKSNITKR
jgi:hypothetical protein